MGIVYDVPRFSERTTAQKGDTCWYYATKMLLKFHDLYDRGAKDAENPLEALHQLRKMLTASGSGDVSAIYSASRKRLRHPFDSRLDALAREQKELKALPPADHPIMQFVREKGIEGLTSQIELVKEAIADTTNSAKMQRVTRLVEQLIGKEVNRYDFLSFALPHVKFRSVRKPDNAAQLEFSLRFFGPLYASGTLSILKTTKDASGRSGSGEAVVAVKDYGTQYGHAVVIAGVTDQEEVFYKDPNAANELKCVHFRHIVGHLKKQLIAIDCTNRGNTDAEEFACLHCAQRVLKQGMVPPLTVGK